MGPVEQAMTELSFATRGRGMSDISAEIAAWLRECGAAEGIVTVFIRHTSASLTIQENADPDVQADLLDAFDRLAPEDAPYRHGSEGPDDMPAHVKSALTSTSAPCPPIVTIAQPRMHLIPNPRSPTHFASVLWHQTALIPNAISCLAFLHNLA